MVERILDDADREVFARDQRTGNAGVCPSCLHRLKSGVWFSLLFPTGKHVRWVACPWCVDLEVIQQHAPELVPEYEAVVRKYRRQEP